jgi:glutathione S-transferase
MLAALNTVEPPILELVTAKLAERDTPWAEERLPLFKDRIRDRVVQLCTQLGAAYVARGEARPAYESAFAAQWAINASPFKSSHKFHGDRIESSRPRDSLLS